MHVRAARVESCGVRERRSDQEFRNTVAVDVFDACDRRSKEVCVLAFDSVERGAVAPRDHDDFARIPTYAIRVRCTDCEVDRAVPIDISEEAHGLPEPIAGIATGVAGEPRSSRAGVHENRARVRRPERRSDD